MSGPSEAQVAAASALGIDDPSVAALIPQVDAPDGGKTVSPTYVQDKQAEQAASAAALDSFYTQGGWDTLANPNVYLTKDSPIYSPTSVAGGYLDIYSPLYTPMGAGNRTGYLASDSRDLGLYGTVANELGMTPEEARVYYEDAANSMYGPSYDRGHGPYAEGWFFDADPGIANRLLDERMPGWRETNPEFASQFDTSANALRNYAGDWTANYQATQSDGFGFDDLLTALSFVTLPLGIGAALQGIPLSAALGLGTTGAAAPELGLGFSLADEAGAGLSTGLLDASTMAPSLGAGTVASGGMLGSLGAAWDSLSPLQQQLAQGAAKTALQTGTTGEFDPLSSLSNFAPAIGGAMDFTPAATELLGQGLKTGSAAIGGNFDPIRAGLGLAGPTAGLFNQGVFNPVEMPSGWDFGPGDDRNSYLDSMVNNVDMGAAEDFAGWAPGELAKYNLINSEDLQGWSPEEMKRYAMLSNLDQQDAEALSFSMDPSGAFVPNPNIAQNVAFTRDVLGNLDQDDKDALSITTDGSGKVISKDQAYANEVLRNLDTQDQEALAGAVEPEPVREEQPAAKDASVNYEKIIRGLTPILSGLLGAAGAAGEAEISKYAADERVTREYENEEQRRAAWEQYASELLGFIPSVSEEYALQAQEEGSAFGKTFIDPATGEVRYELLPGTQEYVQQLQQAADQAISSILGTDVNALAQDELTKAMDSLKASREQDFSKLMRILYGRGLLGLTTYSGRGIDLTTGKEESFNLAEGEGTNPYLAAYETRLAREDSELAGMAQDKAESYIDQLMSQAGGMLSNLNTRGNDALESVFGAGRRMGQGYDARTGKANAMLELLYGPQGSRAAQLRGMLPNEYVLAALTEADTIEAQRKRAMLEALLNGAG